jgi:tRNA(Ile)-lysidine synthase
LAERTNMKGRAIDWPAVATALVRQISHDALHPGAMLTALADYEREKKKNSRHRPRWAIAFSGGADSLALLLIFWAEAIGRWGRGFVVLHFNHRLRGRASDADEKFCAQVCAALGVKFVAGRWHNAPREASEAAARAARLAFFERETTRRKIRLLWFGHQQDDIAESMLMRLARGSGSGGLAAPRPAHAMPGDRWHLRPMLTLKKAEIVAALRAAGATWREDATNAGDNFFRNRIRHSVMPAWSKAAGRDALAGAAHARTLLEEDDVALEAWLEDLAPLDRGGALRLSVLAGKPRAVMRRALHRWMRSQPAAGELSRQGFEALLDTIQAGKTTRHSVGSHGFAVTRGGLLRFEKTGKRRGRFQRPTN